MICDICSQEMDPDAAELGLWCADCRAEFHVGESYEEYAARMAVDEADALEARAQQRAAFDEQEGAPR